MAFTQTQLDSSHLESLKPAQNEAEEDLRKKRDRPGLKKSDIERKVDNNVFFFFFF